MKSKLFSLNSFITSLKGIGSSILTMLSALPLWLLGIFLVKKGLIVVGGLFGLIVLVWYLFFWGYISKRLWRWS